VWPQFFLAIGSKPDAFVTFGFVASSLSAIGLSEIPLPIGLPNGDACIVAGVQDQCSSSPISEF
jgi:hypothetical protein